MCAALAVQTLRNEVLWHSSACPSSSTLGHCQFLSSAMTIACPIPCLFSQAARRTFVCRLVFSRVPLMGKNFGEVPRSC